MAVIGVGLRYLHDHAPTRTCPFSWSTGDRAITAQRRTVDALTDPTVWNETHRHLPPEDALAIVKNAPPVDRLVVCHGEACAPNTIIDARAWSGRVDLGSLGLADRWADLAIATWSTEWNYGPQWELALLNAYEENVPLPGANCLLQLLWDLS